MADIVDDKNIVYAFQFETRSLITFSNLEPSGKYIKYVGYYVVELLFTFL